VRVPVGCAHCYPQSLAPCWGHGGALRAEGWVEGPPWISLSIAFWGCGYSVLLSPRNQPETALSALPLPTFISALFTPHGQIVSWSFPFQGLATGHKSLGAFLASLLLVGRTERWPGRMGCSSCSWALLPAVLKAFLSLSHCGIGACMCSAWKWLAFLETPFLTQHSSLLPF
jgi:hypothetical protein